MSVYVCLYLILDDCSQQKGIKIGKYKLCINVISFLRNASVLNYIHLYCFINELINNNNDSNSFSRQRYKAQTGS